MSKPPWPIFSTANTKGHILPRLCYTEQQHKKAQRDPQVLLLPPETQKMKTKLNSSVHSANSVRVSSVWHECVSLRELGIAEGVKRENVCGFGEE